MHLFMDHPFQPEYAWEIRGAAEPAPTDAARAESALPDGFVYLDEALDGILWDARYACERNFLGAPADGYWANRIVCSEAMLPALRNARDQAKQQGLLLMVWDAARPQRAVDHFVRWSRQPEDGKTKAAHYPNMEKARLFEDGYIAERSAHTRGAAVDLTLVTETTGEPLDMGGDFDLMDLRSHHGAAGLDPQQEKNRSLLKSLMERNGFSAYTNEWWHYTLREEPFPGQFFDFSIEE